MPGLRRPEPRSAQRRMSAPFDDLGTDLGLGRVPGFPRLRVVPPAGERAIVHYEGRLGGTASPRRGRSASPPPFSTRSRLLGQMARRFAMMRARESQASDLVRRDGAGRRRWLMQADEVLVLYLHPDRARLQGPAIDVDEDPLPDVVLEVDHTTDVRRRKLGPSTRRAGFWRSGCWCRGRSSVRAPGLAIHVRRGAGYREEGENRAFPGWKAEEIHLALTEAPMSEPRGERWNGTALTMGAREGTTPQHDPLMASESARVRARSTPGVTAKAMLEAAWSWWSRRSGPGVSRWPRTSRRIGRSSADCRRCPDGGGAGVHGRGRLPAADPGAIRPAHRDSAMTRPGGAFSNWPGDCARSCAAAPRPLARASRTACRIRAAPQARRRTPPDW